MAADNQLHALIGKKFRQTLLRLIRQQLVFLAPVDAHRYDFRPSFARLLYVGCHERAVNVVNLDFRALRDAVCAVGIVQKRHPEAVDIMNHRQDRVAVGLVAVNSEIWHALFLESLYSASHSAVAAVEDVIVGREHEVESGAGQRVDIVVVGAKHRIARIGSATERCLKIHHREISRGDVGAQRFEIGGVVE